MITIYAAYSTALKRFLSDGVGICALLLVLAGALFWPVHSVPTGSRGVITVGGQIKNIEGEGYLLLWPWQKLNNFSVRADAVEIKGADGATYDQQPVQTSLVVRYSIVPTEIAKVFENYSHDGDMDNFIATASMDVFKAVTARYTAPDLIAKRPQVASDIVSGLRVKVLQYGVQILNVDMTNFAFNAQYMAAINEKVTQEQLRQAAENKVQTVIAQQKEKVAVAEAEAIAQKATADGNAYAHLVVATAQANALKVQGNALAQNRDVLELRRIEVELAKAGRWNGALPQAIYANAPIPFLNVPTK